jgi:hypothetical protein
MAAVTIETIQKLKFELLPHSAHSPNLTPSDYHIFRPLKESLCGCRFANVKKVKDTVHTWLHMQPKKLFADGISKLVD